MWAHYLLGLPEPIFTATGHAEIALMAQYTFAQLPDTQTRHTQSNTVFTTLSSDQAQTETTVLITHQSTYDETPRVVLSGLYRDQWEKTEDGWKIVNRAFMNDLSAQ